MAPSRFCTPIRSLPPSGCSRCGGGGLEIGKISVDEASLNLVRIDAGRWNLDPLFRTAAAHAGKSGPAGTQSETSVGNGRGIRRYPIWRRPTLASTIKIGAEKLPFSLLNTDLSFWQQEPGDWRIRLRGQPARTDLSLDLADTGVVRLEASVRRAAELRQMPVHLDLEWREAQLGQLARLVIGSDPGWRGDLTGELHMDGTAEAAQIKTRLRATGVHRAEFAPAAPLDFDARCGFVYHYSMRAVENLECDSPLGNGRIHLAGGLTGDLAGEGSPPRFSVELDRIPVAAGLDALRTVRSGFGPDLEAKGEISGKLVYEEIAAEAGAQEKTAAKDKPGKAQSSKPPSKPHAPEQGPLTGSLTVEGLQLSGDGLEHAHPGAQVCAGAGGWQPRYGSIVGSGAGSGASSGADSGACGNRGDSSRRGQSPYGHFAADALRLPGDGARPSKSCPGKGTRPPGRSGRRRGAGRNGWRPRYRYRGPERPRSVACSLAAGPEDSVQHHFSRRRCLQCRDAGWVARACPAVRHRCRSGHRQPERDCNRAQCRLEGRLSGQPCADCPSHTASG